MKSPGPELSLPDVPQGEDETSFKRHNDAIRAEMAKRGKRNMSVIKELLNISYPMRRHDIKSDSSHVQITLQKYPFLKDPDLVIISNSLHLF